MSNLEKRGLKIDLGHINGHQDENCLFHYLDRWAQLNVIADQEAKKGYKCTSRMKGTLYLLLFTEKAGNVG